MPVRAEVHGGWVILWCPKCRTGTPVCRSTFKRFFLQGHFWRKAANWCDDCEEVRLLYTVWKLSPKMARTLVDGKLKLPKKLNPEAALYVLKLARRKGLRFDPEQEALLVAAAMDAKDFSEPKCPKVR
jgi:hypothetical protein